MIKSQFLKMNLLWLVSLLVFCHNVESLAIRKKVCVIGAGTCGLASVYQLALRSDIFDPVVFEKNSDVGGLWIYTDNDTIDEHGLPVHSSMYKNLRTNAAKELMAFPEYRNFRGENRSYVTHETVLEYLKNYTAHFDLYKYIKFDTLVEKVRPIVRSQEWPVIQWKMHTRNLNTNIVDETICDGVIVCNGNLYEPMIPEIKGIDNFAGKVLHSHSYRRPEDFTGQTVVVLGAGTSGTDISKDLSKYAKVVYLSHRHNKIVGLPEDLIQIPGVVAAEENELILSDGSRIIADVMIYCTGYKLDYPFLDQNSGIIVDNRKFVNPLYKHFINVEHPSMSFIGMLPASTSGFSIFSVQAEYFVAILEGKVKLPNYEEMKKETENYGKVTGRGQWAYYNSLAEEAGFAPLPEIYESIYLAFLKFWKTHKFNFKESNLQIFDDGSVEFVE